MPQRNANLTAVKIHLDKEIYGRAKQVAYRLNLPVKGWIAEQVARGILGWKDPVSGKREDMDPDTIGMMCTVCGGKAKDCNNPVKHKRYEWTKAVAVSS